MGRWAAAEDEEEDEDGRAKEEEEGAEDGRVKEEEEEGTGTTTDLGRDERGRRGSAGGGMLFGVPGTTF